MSKSGIKQWLAWLGALRVTLWLLGLLGVSVTWFLLTPAMSSSWLALPLLLLALNLLGAILSNPLFRRQLPLLGFHLGLLALLLLIVAGRLSYLKGHAEVTVGEQFVGQLVAYEAGPLHGNRLEDVRFLLESFTIDYAPGIQRGATRNYVRWQDTQGDIRQGIVGDHRPLLLAGYRFYSSHNKGFAPLFTWYPLGGKSITGSIHLPAYPIHEFKQALEWTPPNSDLKLWTQLQFDEVILDPEADSTFRAPREHKLIMRHGDKRYELVPGDKLEFASGRLVYDELRTWMGFTVSSDWTLPWLFGAAFFSVMAMAWHYWRKFSPRPWHE